jgi:ABC-type uncharacterized transport system auxiliary subunit
LSGANEFVSGGLGRRVNDESRYVVRTHRGRVDAFLARQWAEPVVDVAAVVYTMKAYLLDPEIGEDERERMRRLGRLDATHVLVAVLAACSGAPTPLTPYRFVANMAGGNNDNPASWGEARLRETALAIIKYDTEWCVVAD